MLENRKAYPGEENRLVVSARSRASYDARLPIRSRMELQRSPHGTVKFCTVSSGLCWTLRL